jgi:putative FmdB family regulatory protein
MPIYVYRCSNCNHEFEHNQKFSDPHLKRCPECGKMTLNKVFTPATDHRSSSGSAPTTPHKKTEDKGENKGTEKKTETTTSETTKPKEVSNTKKEE